jgi:hypothetical protein
MTHSQPYTIQIPVSLASNIKRTFSQATWPEVHEMVDNGSSELLDVLYSEIARIEQQPGELDKDDDERMKHLRNLRTWLRDCCK